MEIKIKPKFKKINRTLSKEEKSQLRKNLKEDGVRDAIVVDQHGYIVDGHNRYSIAQQCDLSFDTVVMEFEDDDAAIDWMLEMQLGRRNVAASERRRLIGLLYNRQKQKHGGSRARGHSGPLPKTAEKVAKKLGVSPNTVKRAGREMEQVEALGPDAEALQRAGKLDAKKVDRIAKLPKEKQKKAIKAAANGKPEVVEFNPGAQHDALVRAYVSPLAKQLKKFSDELGGEGPNYRQAKQGMNELIKGLKKMRAGNR